MLVRECLKQMANEEDQDFMFIELVDCKQRKMFDYHAMAAKLLFHLPTILLNSWVIGIFAPHCQTLADGDEVIIRKIMIQILNRE